MLGSQQFCVRWNSYQTNLQDVFPKLLTNEHFVDVTLACEAQMIKCHKVVLSACSTYFEQLLVHNPCQHPIIFMKDMRHWEVQALVDFMYKGEVNVSQEELASLLKAAEALQIRGLCGADRQLDGKAVSLPPETTLSDSGGRETPPGKRRRQNETKENSTPATPSSAGNANNDVPATSANQQPFRESEQANSSKDDDDQSSIKKEHFDIDDSYYDNDGEDALDLQDDSNSMNQEMSMPTSPLDQAGPSGMSGNSADKAAAAWGQAASLHYMMGVTARRGRPKRDDPSLKAAARLVLERKYTLRQAALQFQIPPTTLRNYLKRSGMLRMPLKRGRPVLQLSGYYFQDSAMNAPSWKYNNTYSQSQPQQSQHQAHPGPHQQPHSLNQQQQLPPQQLHQQQSTSQQLHIQPQQLCNTSMQPPNMPYYPENSPGGYNNMYSECKADMYDIQQLLASKPESMPLEIDLDSSETETDHPERRASMTEDVGEEIGEGGDTGRVDADGGEGGGGGGGDGDGQVAGGAEGKLDGPGGRGDEKEGRRGSANESEDSDSEQSDGTMRMQHPVEKLTCLMTPTFAAATDYDDGAMDMNSSMLHNASPGKARVRRSEDELRQAAECVMKGSTFQTVSDRYNIPISTIRFYMARRGILPQRRRGRSSGTNSSGIAQSPTSPPYQMMHYKLPDIDKPL